MEDSLICPDDNALAAFAGGLASSREQSQIEQHLDGCTLCRMLTAAAASDTDEQSSDSGLAPGSFVGRYRVEACIGAGAMGTVHRAWDPELDRHVAVKVVHARWAKEPAARERLAREARALAQLSHENVLPVYDVGAHRRSLFMAVEWVDGCTPDRWCEGRTVAEVVACYGKVGRGLVAAHNADLIHRDFKPANALIGRDARPLVADFGLVADIDAHPNSSPDSDEFDASDRLTQDGSLVGTPRFMAPEQLRGEPARKASDQFAFCVALYEAVFKAAPFDGDSAGALLTSISSGPTVPAGRAHRRLFAVLARGLREDPSTRYPSMQHLLSALESVGERRNPWRVRIAVATLTVLSGSAVAVGSRLPLDTPEAGHGSAASRLCSLEPIVLSGLDERVNWASRVERYAERWEHARVAACEADADPEVRACLYQQGALLEQVHDATVERSWKEAESAFERLREPDACASSGGARYRARGFDRLERALEGTVDALMDETTHEIAPGGAERALHLATVAGRLGASRARIAALEVLAWSQAMASDGDPDRFLMEAYGQALLDDDPEALVRIPTLGIRLSTLGLDPVSGERWFREGQAQLERLTTVSTRDELALLLSGARLLVRMQRGDDAQAVLKDARASAEPIVDLDARSRLDLVLTEAVLLAGVRRHSAAAKKFVEARSLAEAAGVGGQPYAEVLLGVAKESILSDDGEAGLAAVDALMKACPADMVSCSVVRANGELTRVRALASKAELDAAEAALERAANELSDFDARSGLEVRARIAFLRAATVGSRGRLAEAHDGYTEAVDLASGLSHAFLSRALCGRALAGLRLERYESMLEDVEAAEALADDVDVCLVVSRAHAEAGLGDAHAALRTAERALEAIEPDTMHMLHALALLAKAKALRGRGDAVSEVRAVLGEATRGVSAEDPGGRLVLEHVELVRATL